LGRSVTLQPQGAVHHHDKSPVHVITTAGIRRLSERLGDDVVLRIGDGMPRCVMVDLPQRDLDRDGRILKTLAADGDLTFGWQAHVVRGGRLHRGDDAVLA
jgi:uncharacterized protein